MMVFCFDLMDGPHTRLSQFLNVAAEPLLSVVGIPFFCLRVCSHKSSLIVVLLVHTTTHHHVVEDGWRLFPPKRTYGFSSWRNVILLSKYYVWYHTIVWYGTIPTNQSKIERGPTILPCLSTQIHPYLGTSGAYTLLSHIFVSCGGHYGKIV